MNAPLKAPFPYFGGKSIIAHEIWQFLGDPKTYIEPFFGSGAVLLRRPPAGKNQEPFREIVNDADGYIANVWRAIQFSPDEVAKWCDWPCNHADLMARKRTLIKNEGRLLENLVKDDKWHDPTMAGYWVWAASHWIGAGLTRPGSIPRLSCNNGIASGSIPHLTDKHGAAGLDEPYDDNVYAWMRRLSERLRYVKVVCGDWSRVLGGNWQTQKGPVGIFFDPPYSDTSRDDRIYHKDSMSVAEDVRKWCIERGANKDYRIVLAGYSEHDELESHGWKKRPWKAHGGYSTLGGAANENREKEVLMVSPHCFLPELF